MQETARRKPETYEDSNYDEKNHEKRQIKREEH